MKIARLNPSRVSTETQDLALPGVDSRGCEGRRVLRCCGIYREKASGARADRPELLRMIGELQPGEVVIAEKILIV